MKRYEKVYQGTVQFRGEQKGLCWPNGDEYTKDRWKAIESLLKVADPDSVLDVGAGYADMLGVLMPYTRYVGIEPTQWICDEARKRHPDETILHASLEEYASMCPEKHELVAALGVMATLEPEDDEAFVRQMKNLSSRYILVSFQDARQYKGSFRPFLLAKVQKMFGWETVDLRLLRKSLQYVVLFERGAYG